MNIPLSLDAYIIDSQPNANNGLESVIDVGFNNDGHRFHGIIGIPMVDVPQGTNFTAKLNLYLQTCVAGVISVHLLDPAYGPIVEGDGVDNSGVTWISPDGQGAWPEGGPLLPYGPQTLQTIPATPSDWIAPSIRSHLILAKSLQLETAWFVLAPLAGSLAEGFASMISKDSGEENLRPHLSLVIGR